VSPRNHVLYGDPDLQWSQFIGDTVEPSFRLQIISLFIMCDMMQFDTVYLCALKSRRDGQPNLAHGTETEKGKLKTKTE